ncbi:hypothetical protein FRX31_027920 [Thalictrum thalictroides]|uniref:Uncharacterized protein n=1 Tax=Thalictrum thalictroides TaxID=46969 RepID=A0A7J6VC85_THATH|nr:hypothetical protein FRX31_027920 [Thalictrum thalictroides]
MYVDFEIVQSIAKTNGLLDFVPIFDPEEPEVLEIDSVLIVDTDPIVETITPSPVTLNPLPLELMYAQLDSNGSYPVIISASLTTEQKGQLIDVI